MNCLSVFDHFVGLALKGLIIFAKKISFIGSITAMKNLVKFSGKQLR